MRAVAALLVVWAHAIDLVTKRDLDALQVGLGALENFGAVGVDLFFVISGFIVSITAERFRSMGHFMFARLVRIWPLYLIATSLVWFLDPDARGLAKLAWSIVLLQVPGEPESMPTHPLGWSLMFEVVFYLMLACAVRWRTQRPIQERVLIIGGTAILLGGVYGFHQPLNLFGNPIILEFLLGAVIGWAYRLRAEWPTWTTSALFITGMVLLLSTALYGFGSVSEAPNTLDGSMSWERVRLWGIPAALLIASAVFRKDASETSVRVLVFLGDSSYSIYLFSFIGLILLDRSWDAWAPASSDAAILIATAAAVLFGVAGYLLLERPITKSMRSIVAARPASA